MSIAFRSTRWHLCIEFNRYPWVIQNPFDDVGVAIFRHALILVGVIVVVVIEAHRQPLEDARRQLGGRHAPLLPCVAFKESFIEFSANEAKRLFLKILRIADCHVCPALQEGFRLCRIQRLGIELVDGVQVDRQGINTAARQGLYAIGISQHSGVAMNIFPDPLGIGMENVWAIDMDQHTAVLVTLRMAITRNVITPVIDLDRMPVFSQLACDDGAREPGTGNDETLRRRHLLVQTQVAGPELGRCHFIMRKAPLGLYSTPIEPQRPPSAEHAHEQLEETLMIHPADDALA